MTAPTKKNEKKDISLLVQHYFLSHPSAMDLLGRGALNVAAIARIIGDENGNKHYGAIAAAVRRFSARVGVKKTAHENRIRALISKSKVEIKDRMIVIVIEKPREMDHIFSIQREIRKRGYDCTILEGEHALVVITNQSEEREFRSKSRAKVMRVTRNLSQIIMIFPREIEEIAGVISHIYGLLAHHGVNICEERSCWTDLMFVIENKDLSRVTELIRLFDK